jgi:hypothetical protein
MKFLTIFTFVALMLAATATPQVQPKPHPLIGEWVFQAPGETGQRAKFDADGHWELHPVEDDGVIQTGKWMAAGKDTFLLHRGEGGPPVAGLLLDPDEGVILWIPSGGGERMAGRRPTASPATILSHGLLVL